MVIIKRFFLIVCAIVSCQITLAQRAVDDVNGDGDVNVSDVTCLVDYILGKNTVYGTDINGDGGVDVTDVTELVNHILGKYTLMGHEYVYLGLPSGTLWATCNIGADEITDAGCYFAWGEVETKKAYSWATYRHCSGTRTSLTKYNTNANYGSIDDSGSLELVDDVAHTTWGGSWQIPDLTQIQELRNQCTWTLDSSQNGYVVKGPNGNTIFMPLTGYKYNTNITQTQTTGYYWSKTLDTATPTSAYTMVCGNTNFVTSNIRSYGRCVRAVTK